jgi:hypothetical protein
VTWQSPDTYQPAGLERGTATSTSTTTGTTSFAAAVADSATDGVRRALLLVDLRDGYRRRVPAQANLHSLIDLIFENPVLTGRLVEQRLGVTRPTALRLLSVLAEQGVLNERSTGPRAQRRWDAPEIMSVLTA